LRDAWLIHYRLPDFETDYSNAENQLFNADITGA
jgi:hypothetical protein